MKAALAIIAVTLGLAIPLKLDWSDGAAVSQASQTALTIACEGNQAPLTRGTLMLLRTDRCAPCDERQSEAAVLARTYGLRLVVASSADGRSKSRAAPGLESSSLLGRLQPEAVPIYLLFDESCKLRRIWDSPFSITPPAMSLNLERETTR